VKGKIAGQIAFSWATFLFEVCKYNTMEQASKVTATKEKKIRNSPKGL
jgi:hypothetical protein